jgi:hypothetical protein
MSEALGNDWRDTEAHPGPGARRHVNSLWVAIARDESGGEDGTRPIADEECEPDEKPAQNKEAEESEFRVSV